MDLFFDFNIERTLDLQFLNTYMFVSFTFQSWGQEGIKVHNQTIHGVYTVSGVSLISLTGTFCFTHHSCCKSTGHCGTP